MNLYEELLWAIGGKLFARHPQALPHEVLGLFEKQYPPTSVARRTFDAMPRGEGKLFLVHGWLDARDLAALTSANG
jgi:hypothetical protein